MEGGSAYELLDVTVERPVLDQFQVEVSRTLEDRVGPGLTGDDREERHLQIGHAGLRRLRLWTWHSIAPVAPLRCLSSVPTVF